MKKKVYFSKSKLRRHIGIGLGWILVDSARGMSTNRLEISEITDILAL